MPDFIDNIVDNAVDVNEVVMQGLKASPVEEESNLYCENEVCGEEIPEARRKLKGVKFCIECQTFFENHPHIKYNSAGRVIKQEIVD